ncbi:MAG: hypothetical protein NTX76_01880 [Alphaproteobacteria bacterium]|nr:hypothetical protein [Alphaproteobacteria bacterium]
MPTEIDIFLDATLSSFASNDQTLNEEGKPPDGTIQKAILSAVNHLEKHYITQCVSLTVWDFIAPWAGSIL